MRLGDARNARRVAAGASLAPVHPSGPTASPSPSNLFAMAAAAKPRERSFAGAGTALAMRW